MLTFKSVNHKLKVINGITVIGFIIVILLIMKMNSRTTELNNIFMLNNNISNEISNMEKVSINIYDKDSFEENINQLKTNILILKENLELQDIKLDVDSSLMTFVESLKTSYHTINSLAIENNSLKETMVEKKRF